MRDADVDTALAAYAQGLFPMDDPDEEGPLPFYRADPRAILDVDADGLARLRRRLRRSLARDPGWTPAVDRAFGSVVAGCARPREGGIWLTPRLARLYRSLHAAGAAHSFELWEGDRLVAGVLGVVLGRAAMLESMFHAVPHAGNVNLMRTLERLASAGIELCDIQLASPHTLRLGAREIPIAEFEARLRGALRPRPN
ncbi:MAG TPA: leucyl/phenylalanyl-tRNA--protein transferase [Solirubrobacteraceae bacterium]|nr:leucyl/phenylalanyl-tRNA--protein transferase [Solirubrobacteraceae bacterium]